MKQFNILGAESSLVMDSCGFLLTELDSSTSVVQQSIAPGLGGIGTKSLEKSFLSLVTKVLLDLAVALAKSPSISSRVQLVASGDGTTQMDRSLDRLLPLLSLPRRHPPPGLLAGLSLILKGCLIKL